ncbi:MAG: helix-turn-helix domain-containing protein [Bacteroidetes bacterium]|nr:helix-turn-helix domain-containing protein [Bacteroidota bacterium]
MKRLIIENLSADDLKIIISEAVEQGLKQKQDEDEFFNVQQASQYLKMPVTTLYDYTSNKKIPFHKKGKKLHFSKHELNAWMKTKKEKEVNHE